MLLDRKFAYKNLCIFAYLHMFQKSLHQIKKPQLGNISIILSQVCVIFVRHFHKMQNGALFYIIFNVTFA